jgi:hypothetical protein
MKMKAEIMLVTLIIQTVVQMALYLSTNNFIHCVLKKVIWGLSLSHKAFGVKRQEMTNGLVSVSLIFYNILISIVVLKFTSTGALAGITNLGASVFVGLVMAFQFSKNGKYYIETPEDKSVLERAKEYIKKLGGSYEKNVK